MLQLGNDKMSKSLGNLVSLDEALNANSPDSLRLYFLSSHYRSPLNYTDEGCAAMERSVERLVQAVRREGAGAGERLDAEPFKVRFLEAMDDDLNTPRALAALFDLAREVNRSADEGKDVSAAQETLRHLGGLLGLTFRGQESSGGDQLAAKPFIELLLDTRAKLREARQFELADRIRDGLNEQGVTLEDTPAGTQWEYRPRG